MNNNVLRLHKRKATNFETGVILHEAVNVSEQRQINSPACLQFEYPMDDKARMIEENMLLSCSGRVYEILRVTRVMDGRDFVRVAAKDMFSSRAQKAFLPNVPDMIGRTTSYVIKEALKKLSGDLEPQFTLYTDAELKELGMQWVGDDEFKIDFFSTDKTNLWNFLLTVIECSGRGEIYSNGTKFALVERIGRDNHVRLTLDKNMENINVERDTEDMITRLYPFGSEDLHIGSVNGELAYIDSPMKEIYGVHEGYRDYSDYTEPAKIKEHALWEFNPENEDRIDIPKLTISGNLIDLSKLEEYGDIEKVELGDTVHVYDLDGTEYAERVIEGTWYPFEAHETLISIGHMRRDMFFTIYQLQHTKSQLEAVQTANKSIATRKMQGVVNSDRNPVRSENKQLLLDGDLLYINDDNGKRRIDMGNLNNEFVFIIYDKKGNRAIYLNEQGEAVFSGTIQTKKDCIIQGELRVGMTGNNTKGISFYGDSYQPDENGNYSKPYACMLPWVDANDDHITGINVENGEFCVDSSPVITKRGIAELENTVKELQRQIKYLQDSLT